LPYCDNFQLSLEFDLPRCNPFEQHFGHVVAQRREPFDVQ
jgi:hypothetical protein